MKKQMYYKKRNGKYIKINEMDAWKIARPLLVNKVLEICDTILTTDEMMKERKEHGKERKIL